MEINMQTGQVSREFPINGYPRSLITAGHCVIAGNDETNTVIAFDLNNPSSVAPVASTMISLSSDDFSGLKSLAVDSSTGTVFARSSLACNPVMEDCVRDYNRVISLGSEFAAKIKAACF
jgi:hypothetical protein